MSHADPPRSQPRHCGELPGSAPLVTPRTGEALVRGGVELPELSEAGPGYGVFRTRRASVGWSPWIARFVQTCDVAGIIPILVTGPLARVSPIVLQLLTQTAGTWVIQLPDATYVDVRTRRHFEEMSEFATPFLLLDRPQIALPPPTSGAPAPVLLVELELRHRATADAPAGAVVDHVVDQLGAQRPTGFGLVEPTPSAWDPAALARLAQKGMPVTRPILVEGAQCWFLARYERTEHGVSERIFGVVESDAAAERSAAEQAATAVLDAVDARFRLVTGCVSSTRARVAPALPGEQGFPQDALALHLGPIAIARAGLSTSALEAAGAALSGRAKTPSARFRFGGGTQPEGLAEIGRDLGVQALVSALDARRGQA